MKLVKILLLVTLLLGCQKSPSEPAPTGTAASRKATSQTATAKAQKQTAAAKKIVAKNETPKQQPSQVTTAKNVDKGVAAIAAELASPSAATNAPVPSAGASHPERITESATSVVDTASEIKAEIPPPPIQKIEVTQPAQVAALEGAGVSDAGKQAASENSENSAIDARSAAAIVPAVVPVVPPTATPAPALKINGTMNITFQSREAGIEGGVDTYKVDLTAADALRISGDITRKPRVVSSILGREKSPLELKFALGLQIFHPESRERKEAGRFDGIATLSRDGLYTFSSADGSLAITSKIKGDQGGVSGRFSGSIQGKPEDSDGLLRKYSRWIRGKQVSYKAAHTDPLEFKNLVLAAGPIEIYPEVAVSGNLDYDYDTGNWLTNGISMRYRSGSELVTDKITGSIKWVEDPNRQSNGRGEYQLNLRFNEDRYKKAVDEGDFFASVSDEEAFFMVDDGAPLLSGTIAYRDRMSRSADSDEPTVLASNITYNLSGRDLNKAQLVNFLKLWLLLSGPVNDE